MRTDLLGDLVVGSSPESQARSMRRFMDKFRDGCLKPLDRRQHHSKL